MYYIVIPEQNRCVYNDIIPSQQIGGNGMDLAQIRYFISVADNLSFTRAAEELFVTQPTISKQIALMEKELGIKLFDRTRE